MFEHFFRKYKMCVKTSAKAAFKQLSFWEWFSLGLMLLGIVGIIISYLFHHTDTMLLFGAIIIAFMLVSEYAHKQRLKRNEDELFRRYKCNRLQPLIDLLKDDQFNFWDKAKVEWLIKCCDDRIRESKKPLFGGTKAFTLYIYPLITIMLTAYAQEMTFEIWVITLFAFFSIVFTIEVLKLLLNDLLYPENDELIMLKQNLEYISAVLSTTDGNSPIIVDDREKH